MIKYVLLGLGLLPYTGSFAQTILKNEGATIRVSAGYRLRVEQGDIANNGTINNAGFIYLDRNFSQNAAGTYAGAASSWLVFEGASNQTVQSSNPTDIARLRVQNANRLILGSNLQVSNTLDLNNNSSVQLGNFNLLCPNTNINNYNALNYIISNGTGALIQTLAAGDIKEYPVGNLGYNPVILLSNGGATDNFSVRVQDQILTNGNAGINETADHVNTTWYIDETVAGGNNMDISVEWVAAQELATFDRNNCAIKHWNGSSWDVGAYSAAVLSAGRYSQTRSAVTNFSPFAVVDNSLPPTLPLKWLSFVAQRENNQRVILSWETATEVDNNRFEIERMLDNEVDFQIIAQQQPKNDNANNKFYQQEDENAYQGLSYYRIKQVDNNGQFSYSEIKAVAANSLPPQTLVVYPNPTKNQLFVQHQLDGEATVSIINAQGQIVLETQQRLNPLQPLILNLDLPAAIYTLKITTEQGQIYTQKIVKG
jgi:Secretion system C-terminal sorting domain